MTAKINITTIVCIINNAFINAGDSYGYIAVQ